MKNTTKTDAGKTTAQHEREEARDDSGRFVKNPCELCCKGAPMSAYYSWSHLDNHGGIGIVLCGKCCEKLAAMSEADALAALLAARPAHRAMKSRPAPAKKATKPAEIQGLCMGYTKDDMAAPDSDAARAARIAAALAAHAAKG